MGESPELKLLILTQKVDVEDGVLGFMHDWIIEFSKYCSQLTIICLQEGKHNLPEKVKILSLGKETSLKLWYVWSFYKYIWRERKNYNGVLVHMNKEYVLLGGIFWRLSGKKIALWYNHQRGNVWSRLAGRLAHIIFFTSPFSFFAGRRKARKMPAGVDAEKFFRVSGTAKLKNSILFLGRLAPVKKADVLARAAKILDGQSIDFLLDFVGEAAPQHREYFDKLFKETKELQSKGKVRFLGAVPFFKTPAIYNQHRVFVNLTDSGSFDKTILEAMAAQILVLVSNKSYEEILPPELLFRENDERDLAEKLLKILNLSETEALNLGRTLRQYMLANHDLRRLIKEIVISLEKLLI